MSQISQLLDSALMEEPDYLPDVDAILTAAHRMQRRRHLTAASSGIALSAGVGGVALALLTGGSSSGHTTAGGQSQGAAASEVSTSARVSTSAEPAAPSSTASVPRGTNVHGITRNNLAALIERNAHVRLSGTTVEDLTPTGDINLGAGIASAQGQYLNVQVSPARTSTTTAPTCADVSGNAPDGDGYTGPCRVTAKPEGGYLLVRAGRTADDHYAITQATLVTADGSSITAEATNQLFTEKKGIAPVISQDPPLTSTRLRSLVLDLDSHR